ncbi:histidine phosphatase family protein [Roseibium sp.]|uniref:histidine phosphatase family protein n=1 Tax=Roseibium sp. TaxID=1936156 RepID=UPI003A96FE8E
MTSVLPRLHNPDLLIFLRHGETDWNAEGRMQGQKDIPLNATGMEQARRNGQRLKAYLEDERIDASDLDFLASPLGRTRMTMELARTEMGLVPGAYRLEDRLKELTFGSWEGSTLEEIAETAPELVEQRRTDKWGFVPPGGGESYEMLAQRIGGWLQTIDRPSVVVAHGGVFRVLRGLLEGLDRRRVPKLPVPQDVVFIWRDGRLEEI